MVNICNPNPFSLLTEFWTTVHVLLIKLYFKNGSRNYLEVVHGYVWYQGAFPITLMKFIKIFLG